MTNYTIIENPSSIDIGRAIDIYVALGWGGRDEYDGSEITRSFEGSTYVAIAMSDEDGMIGWVRAMSDGGIATWIAEVVVAPEHQRRGIGGRLMEMATRRHAGTAIYLEAIPGSEEFFSRFGIIPRKGLVACSRAPLPM